MKTDRLIKLCEKRNIQLIVVNGMLQIKAKKGELSNSLLHILKKRKSEIVNYLEKDLRRYAYSYRLLETNDRGTYITDKSLVWDAKLELEKQFCQKVLIQRKGEYL